MCKYTRETMTKQTQTQTLSQPVQVEIPYSEEPMETEFAFGDAVYRMAEAAGFMFAYGSVRMLPSPHYEVSMIRFYNGFQTLDIDIEKDDVTISINNHKVAISTSDLETIYETLWEIAEEIGYGSAIPVNDDPGSEGVVLYGFGKELQIWLESEEINGEYVPERILVKIEGVEQ